MELSSNVKRAASLESLIRNSDFISVHVPYSENTKGFITKERIQMMKEGVVLINLSRNGLVDEDEMKQALDSGKVNKYITDFPNVNLVGNKNVISIPHLGASTQEAEENCSIMVAHQIKNFLNDGSIINSVNFPTSQLERSSDHRITIINKNIPSAISQITAILAEDKLKYF